MDPIQVYIAPQLSHHFTHRRKGLPINKHIATMPLAHRYKCHLPWVWWATFWQTTISYAFSWMKIIEFEFHLYLLPEIQLTRSQHWFRLWLVVSSSRYWLGAEQAQAITWTNASPVHWCIYAALGEMSLIFRICFCLGDIVQSGGWDSARFHDSSTSFYGRYFQMKFVRWKVLYFYYNGTDVCSQCSFDSMSALAPICHRKGPD